jgi:hypothetical protein
MLSSDHGLHVVPEAGAPNHDDVNHKKEYERTSGKEVNGPRGLLAAKARDEPRENRRDGRRHGESGPNHKRKQNGDH